jgi:ComF family protein
MRSPTSSQIWRGILDLFFKTNCPLCGRSAEHIVCVDCDRQIDACRYDQSAQGQIQSARVIPLFAWGRYDRQLKRAITVCKFNNQPQLAGFLGEKMAKGKTIATQLSSIPNQVKNLCIVPIPLHSQKLKTRGFNQSELIAKGFSNHTGFRLLPNLLRRIKNTKPQFETKSLKEREENLHAAFAIDRKFQQSLLQPDFSVMLLDDIYTSGSNDAIGDRHPDSS